LVLNQMGDVPAAQARYEKIMSQYPHAAVAAYRLATLYADRGEQLDVALTLAVMAVQQLPDEPAAADEAPAAEEAAPEEEAKE